MKKLADLIAITSFSVAALLTFQVPSFIPVENLNSIFQYLLIAASFLYFIHVYKLPTLAYFRLPEISFTSLAAFGVVAFYAYTGMVGDEIITLPLWPTISGVVYLFSIGIGEKLISRRFPFGIV
jgi:hypothetical protein